MLDFLELGVEPDFRGAEFGLQDAPAGFEFRIANQVRAPENSRALARNIRARL